VRLRSFWERLGHNWLAKLLSLLAAFLLWYQLRESGPAVERTLERPLEVIGLGKDRLPVGVPKMVLVRVKGTARIVEGMSPDAVVAYLDLSGVEEGPFDRPVRVQIPAGLELAEVTPARIQARVERIGRAVVALEAFVPGEAVLPREVSVAVKGAASQVARARMALAVGIEVGKPLGVAVFDAEGRPVEGLEVVPAKINPRFTGPLFSLREVPLALPGPPPGLVVKQAVVPPKVKLVGPPEALAAIGFVSGEVEWREGSYLTPVRLRLPKGVYALGSVWGRFVVERADQP
jgi:YbbR-like protein.